MAKFKIYGASDDLIEVEGQDAGSKKIGDEFNYYGDKSNAVVLHPSQDVFTVHYGKDGRGVWSVEHTTVTGKLTVSIERAPEGEDPEPDTDTATVEGDIERVEVWPSWPPTAAEIRERLENRIENLDRSDVCSWSNEKVARVLAALDS